MPFSSNSWLSIFSFASCQVLTVCIYLSSSDKRPLLNCFSMNTMSFSACSTIAFLLLGMCISKMDAVTAPIVEYL